MDDLKILRQYGLFDAKVPRYTSYPPANRFVPDLGRSLQRRWLETLTADRPVSIYVHIPFCRRLCWFCACRTQGTKTLTPIDAYLACLLEEIASVARLVPEGLQMERLHLGGGTPTLLTARQMRTLLSALHSAFPKSRNFEFSVEVDPTEAADQVLEELASWSMTRASMGVQDFNRRVQAAIGRYQSFEATEAVAAKLRANGVESLNIDFLYGLPFQTGESIAETIDAVTSLRPDRIALYGYAHVPHMSKRQVMIPEDALPGAETRYRMTRLASERLMYFGYQSLGIDHFALPHDSLAVAAARGKMRRNFQGYTDDPCETLIGLGASAISGFREGYTQNAVATAAYQQRTSSDGLAGHKGYRFCQTDHVVSDVIEQLMCSGAIDLDATLRRHSGAGHLLSLCQVHLKQLYSGALEFEGEHIRLKPGCMELSRLICAALDQGIRKSHIYSMAV
jgi:oxygen-independent coproporphyrinogen-3 oxidase